MVLGDPGPAVLPYLCETPPAPLGKIHHFAKKVGVLPLETKIALEISHILSHFGLLTIISGSYYPSFGRNKNGAQRGEVGM